MGVGCAQPAGLPQWGAVTSSLPMCCKAPPGMSLLEGLLGSRMSSAGSESHLSITWTAGEVGHFS